MQRHERTSKRERYDTRYGNGSVLNTDREVCMNVCEELKK